MGKVKCLICGTELESKYRHDFRQCACENETFVDGGNDYMRVGGKDWSKIACWNEETQEYTAGLFNDPRMEATKKDEPDKKDELDISWDSIDKDGYPTEEALGYIKNYDILNQPIKKLIEFIQELWSYKDFFILRGKKTLTLELHTGGWSGNESIIQALAENILFWSMYWEKSVRGGHYYFKITKIKKVK